MAFPYKHILVIGATSGIGKAIADKLVASGVSVTAVGRRKDRLEEFVAQHGSDKTSYIVFDIAKQSEIPGFAADAIKSHPSIDCVFLNAGVQASYNFTNPSSVNLAKFHEEVKINFSAQVDLVHAFLPHLLKSPGKTAFIYTGTHISLVPAMSLPAYSASKSALDAFMLCIRDQVKDKGVKVFHLSAPPVQTEIHDKEMGEKGRSFGMPAADFANQSYEEIVKGNQDIYIGAVGGSTAEQTAEMGKLKLAAVERLTSLMKKMMAAHK